MGFDIFNNHSHYNQFKVYNGLTVSTTPAAGNYVLERKLKKLTGKAGKTVLEQLAGRIYGKIGYNSTEIIRELLTVCIESCGHAELTKALEIHKKNGLEACIMYLIKL